MVMHGFLRNAVAYGLFCHRLLAGPLHNQHIKSLQSSAAAPAAAAYQPPQQLAQPLDPPSQLSEDAVVQVMDVNPLHDSYKALLQPSAMQHQGTAGYQQPEVVTSPLCPVAAVGGLWAEAGHKLVMHVAVYASKLPYKQSAAYQDICIRLWTPGHLQPLQC